MSVTNDNSETISDTQEPTVSSVSDSLGIRLPSVRPTHRRNPRTIRRVRSSGSTAEPLVRTFVRRALVRRGTCTSNRTSTRKNVRHRALEQMDANHTSQSLPESAPESADNTEVEDSGLGDQMSSDEMNRSVDSQATEINEDSNQNNENQSQENQDNVIVNASNESNVCIDLTEDDSLVNENNPESDAEIECISSTIPEDSDVFIVRDTKRRRRQNMAERSRSPTRSDDIIEISSETRPNHSQTDKPKPIPTQSASPNSARINAINSMNKSIKCPVCLEEYLEFQSTKQLMSTNCGHLFCDNCIKLIVKTTKSCPTCRKKIATHKSYHPIYL